jgi:hypothetical protein
MPFFIKQNDTSPSLVATLKDFEDDAINLTDANVRFHMKSIDGTLKIDAPMTIVSTPTLGLIRYDWQTGDTDTVGTYYVEFEVTYADNTVETFPNTGSETVSVIRDLN